jgi:hypothetical protein
MRFKNKPRGSQQTSNLHALSLQNIRSARRRWGASSEQISMLKVLTEELRLSVTLGDLSLLNEKWYVTHSGLLRLARRNRCAGIQVRPIRQLSDPLTARWVFCATVYKSPASRRFVGYGDADPSNVSSLVRGAEMRIAETRAVNRALRKAYGIGLCSVEELGAFSSPPRPSALSSASNGPRSSNGSGNGQPRLRDQLCLLIRQFNLDANLVKLYAADFCGTATLSGASRELVESFISHLAAAAKENRGALICKLNSYAQPLAANP